MLLRTVVAGAILLSVSLGAGAEERGREPGGVHQSECMGSGDCNRGGPEKHMVSLLSLRDDQIEPVMSILRDSQQKRRGLGENGRDQHEALFKETLTRLGAYLDKQQIDKFVEFSEEMKSKRHGRQQGEKGGRGMPRHER